MESISELLACSTLNHHHVCPRQVLGIRMGLLAGKLFEIALPQTGKRLIAIVETDGCLIDGISAATNCLVGRRTMRIEDFGKIGATFVDSTTGQAVRITPNLAARRTSKAYAPEARSNWEAQLLGYQRMPDEELLITQKVSLNQSIEKLVSRPGKKAICQGCGEEIINEREVVVAGKVLCLSCAGQGYYAVSLPAEDYLAVHIPSHLPQTPE